MACLPPDITAILQFHETGAQFFKRIQQERVLTGFPIIDNNLCLRPGVVLEVAGPSGSGKTELLLSLALHVLLSPYTDPNAWLVPHAKNTSTSTQSMPLQQQPVISNVLCNPAVDLQDQPERETSFSVAASIMRPPNCGSVVILDLDGKFDGVRLMQVLEPQVHSAWQDQQQRMTVTERSRSGRSKTRTRNGGSGGTAPGPSGSGPVHDASACASASAADTVAAGASAGGDAEPQLLGADEVVEEVLSRLQLVRCRSSLQLVLALAGLPARMEEMQLSGAPCRLLLLDNVGAHYWTDRAAKNLPAGGPGASGGWPAGGRGLYSGTSTPGPAGLPHPPSPMAPLALSLFEMHSAIAARLVHVSRTHRLPVVATKTAAVTARWGVESDGGNSEELVAALGGEGGGGVQLQQREFMPMPWQSVVTHRLLLYPRGVVTHGPPQHQQHALQSMTAILAEMLDVVGHVAPSSGAPAASAATAAVPPVSGGTIGSGGPRAIAQLLVSSVAMVEEG